MTPELLCPEGVNRDGAYRLEWSGEGTHRLTEDGALLYEGRDTATTVTGRREGSYSYELRTEGATSEVARCEVIVEPHGLAEAFGLLGLGALVFSCVVIVVVRGHRAHRAGRIG